MQITASKTALLLQCPRPFSKGVEIEPSDPGEAALYGQQFHRYIAALLREEIPELLIGEPTPSLELVQHVHRAYDELQAWMKPDGNPFGLQFEVTEVESSRALELGDGGYARKIVLNDPDGLHEYEDLRVTEMGCTADAILEAPHPEGGIFRVVLDHKTGEYDASSYTRPAENEQMQSLALAWGAHAVAILHTPRQSAPVIYSETVSLDKFQADLWAANRLRESGFLRPGPECKYCPARASCPAKQGELIASTSKMIRPLLQSAPMAMSHTTVDKGHFHLLLSEFDKLQKQARAQLREEVRGGAIIERPDGKVLELVMKNVERLSKKSIVEAYGKVRGEEVLQRLRDDGALSEVPQEELRAK